MEIQPRWLRADLGVKVMKMYSTLPKGPEQWPHHLMLLSVIPMTLLFLEIQSADSKLSLKDIY